MQPKTRQQLKLVGIIAAYAVVLVISITILVADRRHGHALPFAARVAAALAPMLPALLIIPFTLQNFRLMDEMQVRHQLEALAVAAGAAGFLALGYGFLELVGFPKLSMFWVWSVLNGLWVAAVGIQRWRYR